MPTIIGSRTSARARQTLGMRGLAAAAVSGILFASCATRTLPSPEKQDHETDTPPNIEDQHHGEANGPRPAEGDPGGPDLARDPQRAPVAESGTPPEYRRSNLGYEVDVPLPSGWTLTRIEREDGRKMSAEEIEMVIQHAKESAEKERRSLKAVRSELPKEMKERLSRKIAEHELADQAYDRLQARIKSRMLGLEYLEALRMIEVDPDFVKYRDHPRFRKLRDELEALARARRREGEGVPGPADASPPPRDADGREER